MPTTGLRVAMVSPRFSPYTGGIETHMREVGMRLSRQGIDLTILTTDASGRLPREEHVDGFTVRRFPTYPRSRDYYLSPPLVRAIRRADFDLCHMQGVHSALAPMALRAARHAGIPTVLTFHTGGSSSRLRKVARPAQWRALAPELRRVRRLVAVCEFERRLFSAVIGAGSRTIDVVRNGADPLPVDPENEAPFSGAPLVVSVGRLERYKGHHRVIAALPALRRAAPAAHLVVVGSGPFEASLRRQVHLLGLEESVDFTAFDPTERAALGGLVGRADVVALLSEYEAHPVAVMEALASRRDVLCADTSGLSELGSAGLVHTVPLNASPADIGQALLATANERRWSARGPALPSWDECTAGLLSSYEAAAG